MSFYRIKVHLKGSVQSLHEWSRQLVLKKAARLKEVLSRMNVKAGKQLYFIVIIMCI